jgi:protein-S-isoprenylcysteine O-methyltransferase Ste14
MKDTMKRTLLVIGANLANPVLALMWGIFAMSTYLTWLRTHAIVALLLFFVNTLFALLFVLRRHSVEVSENPKDWMITASTILLSFTLHVQQMGNIYALAVAQAIQGIGVTVILISLVALGRSFGLIPANRDIKTHSLYSYVRHPLYTGELLFYFGFLIGNLSWFNAFIVGCIFMGLNLRATAEERLLSHDKSYVSYLETVRFRFFPKLF